MDLRNEDESSRGRLKFRVDPQQPVPVLIGSPVVQGFVPLAMASSGSERDVRIELSRGTMSIKVSWPVRAAGACALWVREVMR